MNAHEGDVTPAETNGTDAHSGTTSEYVIDALNRAGLAFAAFIAPATPVDRRRIASYSYMHHVTAALLHECIADPARASAAVRWLEGALEDDTAAQWVHEARVAVAEGRPIPLPYDEIAGEVSQ
jgi:hypothetical protein